MGHHTYGYGTIHDCFAGIHWRDSPAVLEEVSCHVASTHVGKTHMARNCRWRAELRPAASNKQKPQSFSLKKTANELKELSPIEPLIRSQPQQMPGLQLGEILKQRTELSCVRTLEAVDNTCVLF